jgi:hypothetical protein
MKRIYESLIADHFANNRQMAFLSGPRQVGKTTLAVPYAFQVAINAPGSDLHPSEFAGTPIKISALDLLKVLV